MPLGSHQDVTGSRVTRDCSEDSQDQILEDRIQVGDSNSEDHCLTMWAMA